ncbi:MAG: MBL fold metallo-hydrolase [Opitutaceae bacterium]|nr:MBL fold metallo-hydrolase [Cytophagales bacterium]
MRLHLLETGLFKLDGGAMYGVVPQSLWKKLNAPDENNMCTWAMRSLLIEEKNNLTLIDTGIGNKQEPKFFNHYFLHGDNSLEKSLNKLNFSPSDIANVFLTHLHFDHAGGAIKKVEDNLVPAFENANYWTNSDHWNWAIEPNPREKASFLKENIFPIYESGQLKWADKESFTAFDYIIVDGHTEKMMLPKIICNNKTFVFVSDLIPSIGHIPLAYIMSYDVRPLITMAEKRSFLEEAAKGNWILIFQHDPNVECCTVKFSEKGIVPDEVFKFSEVNT